jgi:hypothetical protein
MAAANNFWFTGVFLLPGNDAPASDRAPLLVRSVANELLMCERWFRYIRQMGFYAYAAGAIPGTGGVAFSSMRKVPAATFANTTYTNSSGISVNTVSINSVTAQWNITAAGPSYVVSDILLDARS